MGKKWRPAGESTFPTSDFLSIIVSTTYFVVYYKKDNVFIVGKTAMTGTAIRDGIIGVGKWFFTMRREHHLEMLVKFDISPVKQTFSCNVAMYIVVHGGISFLSTVFSAPHTDGAGECCWRWCHWNGLRYWKGKEAIARGKMAESDVQQVNQIFRRKRLARILYPRPTM